MEHNGMQMRRKNYTLRDVLSTLLVLVADLGFDKRSIKSDGEVGCTYGERMGFGIVKPVCIVGHYISALGYLGLIYNEADYEGGCAIGSNFWNRLAMHGLTWDEDAKKFLHTFQGKQDDGFEWGAAFYYSVEYMLRTDNSDNYTDNWDALNTYRTNLLRDMGEAEYRFLPLI